MQALSRCAGGSVAGVPLFAILLLPAAVSMEQGRAHGQIDICQAHRGSMRLRRCFCTPEESRATLVAP